MNKDDELRKLAEEVIERNKNRPELTDEEIEAIFVAFINDTSFGGE